MKKLTKFAALLLAAVVCAGTAAAETIAENGVTYESAKVDSRRLVRYSPDKPETEFTIADTSVDAYAFEGAENLQKITIGDGVFYIGEYAFKDCTSLKEVVIDKTWGGVVIPENAFDGCTSLDPAVVAELCWENPFHDVYPQERYYDAVKFVHKNGIMNGMSDDRFAPDTGMTRAMFVTVLGRLTGVGTDKVQLEYDPLTGLAVSEGPVQFYFHDVDYESWYGPYVDWAAATGLVEGYGNGKFGVDDNVTIEQAAVILYRYADLIETPLYDMEADYTDTDEISAWAKDAMRWVTATDIYTGYDGELRPKQNAPRALVAEMLYNYVRETEKPDEIPEKKISEVENPDWGLTLTASNVTPTGMTLTFTQSGGNVNDDYLNSGSYYYIETYKDGQWTEVEPKIRLNAWTEEGWSIPLNGEFVIDTSWEPLYGELPVGQYRMGKRVSDDWNYATFYAEFTIVDPAEDDWGMNVHAEGAAPYGLTLVFTFSGKKPDGDLQHGSDYILEQRKNGEWLPVSEKPFDFTAEAIVFLPKEIEEVPEKVEWAVDWTNLYGELPAGEYRIVKEIMNFRGGDDYDTKTFYAEFTIE